MDILINIILYALIWGNLLSIPFILLAQYLSAD
jgi:Mn2+/Fe2+ NRAMP family transporter